MQKTRQVAKHTSQQLLDSEEREDKVNNKVKGKATGKAKAQIKEVK